MSDALYKDKFCELKKTTLKISCYTITMQPKVVNLADIRAIYYEPHGFDFGKTKSFGKSCSPVWWAMGIKRTFSNDTNVVIDNGEKTLKGFSVKDINEFLGYIKQLANPGVIVEDKFPFSINCKAESAD